jgi:hydrogenase maturation protease
MSTGTTVVIGVGNPYRCDDGVGPAVIDLLKARRVADAVLTRSHGEAADLIEGWSGANLAILVDAIVAEPAHPGRVHRLAVHQCPTERTRAASSHGLDFGEAVELARVLGRLPDELVLYAVEVERVEYGTGLSPAVAEAAARVAEQIGAELAERREPAVR